MAKNTTYSRLNSAVWSTGKEKITLHQLYVTLFTQGYWYFTRVMFNCYALVHGKILTCALNSGSCL